MADERANFTLADAKRVGAAVRYYERIPRREGVPDYGEGDDPDAVNVKATSTLTLGGLLSGTVTVTADSTQFPVPGHGMTADAFLCIDSNDANNPVVAVPVHALQQ